MRFIILVNPNAGRGKTRLVLREALAVIRRGGISADVQESRDAQHLLALARLAATEKPDAVVSLGGDGTQHYVLNGITGSAIPMGIIPCGSGNDLAKGLGIPIQTRAAAQVLCAGNTRRVDLGRVGNTVFSCIAGAGFDSVVTRYNNERVRWLKGSLAYAWSILRSLENYRPEPLEIVSDVQRFSGEVIFAVVGNNVSYGGGIHLTPRARLDDGLLDVCIVPYIGKWELLRWVPSAYRGQHLRHPRIIYFQTPKVSLKSASRLELFGDGEFMQELPATIEIVPRGLSVIVPSTT
ncbi:MAG: diacylglycerol kinase family protein [Terriglobia bacterium]|jgi:diacylglycerol kinase (ATP)